MPFELRAIRELAASRLGKEGPDWSALLFHSRFRRHPGFSEADIFTISRRHCEDLVTEDALGFCLLEQDAVMAFCAIVPNRWESDFFCMPMARVQCFTAAAVPDTALDELLARSLSEAFAAQGIRHFSIDIDVDDYTLVNVFIRAGFEMMDLKRTYFANKLDSNPAYEKLLPAVTNYRPEDLDEVSALVKEVSFTTRFTRDPHVSKEKADQLYRQWFHQLLDDAGKGSQVVVFRKLGAIVGCGGIGEMDFSRYGIARCLRTGSLYACTPSGVGGYAPVLFRLTRDALASHGLVETTVSLNNAAAVRVVEGVRPNRSVTVYCMRRFLPL
jgi:hypothetical protein